MSMHRVSFCDREPPFVLNGHHLVSIYTVIDEISRDKLPIDLTIDTWYLPDRRLGLLFRTFEVRKLRLTRASSQNKKEAISYIRHYGKTLRHVEFDWWPPHLLALGSALYPSIHSLHFNAKPLGDSRRLFEYLAQHNRSISEFSCYPGMASWVESLRHPYETWLRQVERNHLRHKIMALCAIGKTQRTREAVQRGSGGRPVPREVFYMIAVALDREYET